MKTKKRFNLNIKANLCPAKERLSLTGFRLPEITKAVGGQLLCGDPQLRIRGVSIDSRTIKGEELFIAIKGEHFDGYSFIREAIRKGVKAIIIPDSPDRQRGVPPRQRCQLLNKKKVAYIKVADTRRALADLARFHRQRFNIPIIAVAGSTGKTTIKDMLAWVLSSRAKVLRNPGTENNAIGISLALLKLDISYDIVILELGTNHFGEIAYLVNIAQPNLGIITNIRPAHLEYLRNLAGVYKEKVTLLKKLKPPKIVILNADESRLRRLKNDKKNFILTYGIKNKCNFYARVIKLTSRKTLEFIVNSKQGSKIRLNTVGYANIYNALAVIAAARLFGCSYKSISQRLARFVFPGGRLRWVKLNGISFIDDTYNANPASLSEALSALSRLRVKGRRIFVMGDMLELGKSAEGFHRQAGVQIARICDIFIGVGKLTQLTAHWAHRSGLSKDCVFTCQDSRQAASLLLKTIKPNHRDLILVKGSRLMKMEEVFKQG